MAIYSETDFRTLVGLNETDEGDLLDLLLPQCEIAVEDWLGYNPEQLARTEFYPRIEQPENGNEGIWDSDGTRATYTQLADSQASDILQLRHIPLRSIASLYIDENAHFGFASGSFAASTLQVFGTDYYPIIDSTGYCPTGQVKKVSGSWPTQLGSIKITYTAGFTAAEFKSSGGDISGNAIKQAIEITALRAYKQIKAHQKNERAGFVAGPISEEKLGEYWYKTDWQTLAKLVQFTVRVPSEAAQLLSKHKHYGQLVA
mgnify:CR=1 FL=1